MKSLNPSPFLPQAPGRRRVVIVAVIVAVFVAWALLAPSLLFDLAAGEAFAFLVEILASLLGVGWALKGASVEGEAERDGAAAEGHAASFCLG